jgi:hypothetical protein
LWATFYYGLALSEPAGCEMKRPAWVVLVLAGWTIDTVGEVLATPMT